jgi:cell wall-associated NlpC family hydrolase
MLGLKATGLGRRRGLRTALASGCALLALGGCGEAGSSLVLVKPPPRHHPRNRIAEEQPPHPQPPYAVAPKKLPKQAEKPHPQAPAPEPTHEAAPEAPEAAPRPSTGGGSPATLPPASAGTNGSAKIPASGESKQITPSNMAYLESQEAAGFAVLLNGIALAPPEAPERIKAAISAANEIVGRPYIWGGGHASWYSRGYDCSGAVSYALAGGGFLQAPLASGPLESWGAPGPGHWLTVYANAGHAYAVIAGLRWDTVGDARGTGPRWHAALPYPEGFVARHPPGY